VIFAIRENRKMPELILHFQAAPETNLEAAAADLKAELAGISDAETVEAKPQRFQSAVNPAEILAVVTFVATMAQNVATIAKAVQDMAEVWKKVKAKFPGLHPPTVEVGLRSVAIDQIKATDIEELIED
jgi:hypothetical protein